MVNLKNKNLKMLILSYQMLIGQSVCNDITLHYITLHYITLPSVIRTASERLGLPGPEVEVVILSVDDADTPADNLDENDDCKIYCLGLSP